MSSTTVPTAEVVAVAVQPAHASSRERAGLCMLIILYSVCATGFALVTPYGEAPDEPGHFLYVDYLVRVGKLPEIGKTFYTPDSFHPPLYYSLGAGIILVAQTITGTKDDNRSLGPVLFGNPDYGNGVGYNVDLHPADQRWPLWPSVMRALSILMGLGVVLLTYFTARALVPPPAPAIVPLIATSFAALIPQANFIRASVSNENLASLMGAWIIWLLLLHLTRAHSTRRVVWIGIAFGLALLTKLSLAPFVLPILLVLWLKRPAVTKYAVRDLVAFATPVLILAGWYYAYRWAVYGDPLATTAWHAMLPPDNMYQWSDLFWFKQPFRDMLWTSFWATYGWQNIWMPDWTYTIFLVVTVIGAAGVIYLMARGVLTGIQRTGITVMLLALLLMYMLVIQASTYLIAWQGREMYPALSSVCVLLGAGLAGVVLGGSAVQPDTLTRAKQYAGVCTIAVIALGLFAANIYSIFWLVLPGLNPKS